MGGVWGLASSTALENLPVEARGLGSGVLQQGYAIGYLISAVLNLYVVPHTRHTWRALFWTTSVISAIAAIIRAIIPESEVFLRAKEQQRAAGGSTGKKTKVFIHQVRMMLKTHWRLCVYAILLMAGALLWHMQEDVERTKLWGRFQLPFSWFPRFVPYLSSDNQRFRQIPFDRRNNHRQCRSYHVCLSHRFPFVHAIWLQYACSWRILCAIWRTGCVGCDPHTARRDEPTWIPCYLPWCCIPTRKRTRFCYTV